MAGDTDLPPGLHFAGVNTRLLLRYLREQEEPGAVARVLKEAGETRTADELLDNATWSSYDQFRRLLETTSRLYGGFPTLTRAASGGLTDGSQAEMTAMLQSLGSPSALLAVITESGGAGLAPAIAIEGHEVDADEWVVREWFAEEFAPFPEYCAWAAGLYSNIPTLFGMRAQVTKEACACEGAAACEYRIRWFPDDATVAADNFEARIRVLTARLEGLQQMVGELVSDDDLERVLTRIVVSAARSMSAPQFVLALEKMPAADKRVYSVGVPDDAAERLASEILVGTRDDDEHHLIVEVQSNRRRYGRLAAVNPTGRFFPHERVVFQAYARLVACALDSAAAVEEARRQAESARALLELSNSLAEIATTDEMAAHIARAVTRVIGCDRAAVILFEPDAAFGRVVATHGYSTEAELRLRTMEIPVSQIDPGEVAVNVWDRTTAAGRETLSRLMSDLGSVAVATIPIGANSELVGMVVGDVVDRPERLTKDPDVSDRLRGVASQATIAIGNARLLESIRHQALHDSLTGLPNRTLILDRVEQMLARARRRGTESAALFIDLDGFKQVNDTLGHDTGDRLLQSVAARLSAALREADTIARLGGDEFVVLVEGGAATGSPEFVAERLLEVLREPFEIENAPRGMLRITASIGIAFGSRIAPTDLLRDADIALYAAKTAGRDRYVTFEREMQTAVEDRLTLELDLRAAIERGEFFLVYQPIFDLDNGRVLGVEALVRWNHPVRGVVQPDTFIPLLEETKQIVDVGRWVLNEACRQASEWHLHERGMYVSVNVSARQLDDDHLVQDLRTALRTSGLDPAALVIEITETAIMHDSEMTARQLRVVKTLGVGIAIDDFGTGYSSLSYLRQFPVDILKIDRSFITPITDSAESKALLHTLVQLGKQLGLKTLAEGIEQHEQFCQLQVEQCDSGQGFMFARPLGADDVEDFLASLPHPQLDPGPQDSPHTAKSMN
jgi:diguanylate cyclase (GGDEF)-like protein